MSGHTGQTLLVVDDEPQIRRVLKTTLTAQGYAVDEARTGEEALEKIRAARFDLILLDMNMPGMDGIETCREVRRASNVPILMLTVRSAERDKVAALDAGADDYVVKPFGFRELVARIRAVTRRVQPRPDDAGSLRVGPLFIDRRTRRVTLDGQPVVLTAKEFDLLAFLAADPDAVLARHRILEEVWDPHWYGPTKTLDVHIATLRKKLGNPEWIETVRGVGFRLHPPPMPG